MLGFVMCISDSICRFVAPFVLLLYRFSLIFGIFTHIRKLRGRGKKNHFWYVFMSQKCSNLLLAYFLLNSEKDEW